jgi:predicted phage baseplate assembly protein
MTRPWWDTDVAVRAEVTADRDLSEDREHGRPALWQRPRIHTADAAAIAREAFARRAGFTPTWTSERTDDAGRVLVDLVAGEVATTAECLDNLTLKTRFDLLSTAGIGPLPPRPLSALLTFEVSASAPRSVTIAQGFRVVARDANGQEVLFETLATIVGAPGTIAAAAVEISGALEAADLPTLADGSSLMPFGRRPELENALYIGLDAPISPFPEISIAWFAQATGEAPPVASSGSTTTPPNVPPTPLLEWEVLDGNAVIPAEVLSDDTRALTRTGLLALRVPLQWRPSSPLPGTPPRRWLRARLVQGRYVDAPRIAQIGLNGVWALSGETIRREVLTPIAQPGERARRFQLARSPVLANADGTSSLDLVVDEGGDKPVPWQEQSDLASWGPDDRFYRLDPSTGVVEFGDGIRGREVPDGFRHVQARSYRVYKPAGRIVAGAINAPAGSAPFVLSTSNPAAASGAVEVESLADVLRRGPQELASRRRAVTVEDYRVEALRAPGADVQRVYAEAGFYPEAPGRPMPGVVGLLVVSADPFDGNPPQPSEQTLRAIVEHLKVAAAPAGIDIRAAAPEFARISVDLSFVAADSGVDLGRVVDDVIRSINRYLHPLTGGDDETGWPFGAAIRQVALVRALLENNADVRAVPRVAVTIDGVRYIDCAEWQIGKRRLLWPEAHRVIPTLEQEVK